VRTARSNSEIDSLAGRPIILPRKLRHLDLTRCVEFSDRGVRTFVNNIPRIEYLKLAKCYGIFDGTLTQLLPTTPVLAHLDLEELEALTNAVLQCLASSPRARSLLHLKVSDCTKMGYIGMLAVLQTCAGLRSLGMGSTRGLNLVLSQTAAMARRRSLRTVLMDRQHSIPAFHGSPLGRLRLLRRDVGRNSRDPF
jgi:F-box/leucine-rich repeat protein 2/20